MLNKRRFNYLIQIKSRKAVHILIFTIFLIAFGQSFAQYEMKKYTINSGGEKMYGGKFEMQSSVGQVDASNTLSNGNFQLNSGFWHKNISNIEELIFNNGFE